MTRPYIGAGLIVCSSRPIVTEKVLEYLAYKTTYENAGPKEEIPDFYERVMPELALELLSRFHSRIARLPVSLTAKLGSRPQTIWLVGRILPLTVLC